MEIVIILWFVIIFGLFGVLVYHVKHSKNATHLEITVTDEFKQPLLEENMAFILTDSQKVNISVAPKTAAGNDAVVDGAPVWTSSNPDVLTVMPSEDGFSAVVETTGLLGTAQISVVVDADTGEGVTELAGVENFEVKAGQAVSLGLAIGEPETRL